MIVYGMMIMTGTLLIIGCLAIPRGTPQTLAAMVAMMTIWGWLVSSPQRHTHETHSNMMF
jgi:hypothetical protein